MGLRQLVAVATVLPGLLSWGSAGCGGDAVPSVDEALLAAPTGSSAPPESARGGFEAHVGASAATPFILRDTTIGLEVRAQLLGATDAPCERDQEAVLCRGALGDATVSFRVTNRALEDVVVFGEPTAPHLDYLVDLFRGVAGLRLVSNTLEFLDSTGTPRLRVAPPWVVDGDGVRHDARLSIADCAVDTSPAAPWGRRITPPGASACRMSVTWPEGLPHPLTVDPLWSATGSMISARTGHTAQVLSGGPLDGKVLVAGGTSGAPLSTCELFDSQSKTWAATGVLTTARTYHGGASLAGGSAIVAGGNNGGTKLTSAEKYNPASGTWSAAGNMPTGRNFVQAIALQDGKVLAVGGVATIMYGAQTYNNVSLNDAALYDPAMNSWAVVAPMFHRRTSHTVTLFNDGRVLVTGGTGTASASAPTPQLALGKAEVYNPGNQTWTSTADLTVTRADHRAVLLPDGRVFVVGGNMAGGPNNYTASTEFYSPGGGMWMPGGSMLMSRAQFSMSGLADGRVLVAGGVTTNQGVNQYVAESEVYDPAVDAWVDAGEMSVPRVGTLALGLASGEVLVPGGSHVEVEGMPSTILSSVDVFSLLNNGEQCAANAVCKSFECVEDSDANGVCCQTPCAGPCEACGADGVCRPAAEGTDPDDDCADDGAVSCDRDGMCDGAGACRLYAEGTECGENGCDDGGNILSALCNGGGECISGSVTCAPYLCDPATGACFASCMSIDQCAEPNICAEYGDCEPFVGTPQPIEHGFCACDVPGAAAGDVGRWGALLGLGLSGLALRRRWRRERRGRWRDA